MNRQSTENIVKAYVEAANRDDRAAQLALVNEDVSFNFNHGTHDIGIEKLRWLLATGAAFCKEQLADAVVLSSEDGSRGAVEYTWRGTYLATIEGMPKASGQRFALQAALFFEIDDSKITRISGYRDMQEWIRQVSED